MRSILFSLIFVACQSVPPEPDPVPAPARGLMSEPATSLPEAPMAAQRSGLTCADACKAATKAQCQIAGRHCEEGCTMLLDANPALSVDCMVIKPGECATLRACPMARAMLRGM